MSGRRPEDDHPQIVYDIVEAVFHARRDVRDATGANLHVRHRKQGPTRDHVVDLVLGVRLLVVGRSRRPVRDGQAQRGRAEELGEVVPVGVEPGEQVPGGVDDRRLHRPCLQ